MKAVLFCLMSVSAALGQVQTLSPTAEFPLNAKFPSNRLGKKARVYLQATPSGLTFLTIGQNQVLFTSADPDGGILYARSDLASVHARFHAALPCPDGSFWLVSSDPYSPWNDSVMVTGLGSSRPDTPSTGRPSNGQVNAYKELDRYSAQGTHMESVRLLAQYGAPIAAGSNEEIVLRYSGYPGPVPASGQDQLIHFGTVADKQFKEQAKVRLVPMVWGSIPLLASNGDLLLIDKSSGNILVIDPKAQHGTVVRLAKPHPVRAAATDSDSLYLLSGDALLKTDLAGQTLATYQLQMRRGFLPASLAVTGHSLYYYCVIKHDIVFLL